MLKKMELDGVVVDLGGVSHGDEGGRS